MIHLIQVFFLEPIEFCSLLKVNCDNDDDMVALKFISNDSTLNVGYAVIKLFHTFFSNNLECEKLLPDWLSRVFFLVFSFVVLFTVKLKKN